MLKANRIDPTPLSAEEISDVDEYYSEDEEAIHFSSGDDLIDWLHS